MRTIKLTLQYDGTEFVGWQRQRTGESIQGLLEDALARIEGAPVSVHGAGRTDAGVHALGQVASVRLQSALEPETLARALNANLPASIRVFEAAVVPDDFHARFSAVSKTYEYRIWNGPAVPPFVRQYVWHVPNQLDAPALEHGAAAISGEHDFAAFQGSGATVRTTVRRVSSARWQAVQPGGLFVFEIAGDGFLRHMVRSLVGTLVEIGQHRRPVEDIARLLQSTSRAGAGRTAPAQGLILTRVDYPAPVN